MRKVNNYWGLKKGSCALKKKGRINFGIRILVDITAD